MRTSTPLPVLEALRERIQRLEGGGPCRKSVLPFGIKAIDQHLPEGGLALGALHEVAGGGNGAIDGAAAALFAAGIAARTRGRVLWCVARQDLFAPAIAQAGLLPDRVIYVEAGDEKSLLACFEEGLRAWCAWRSCRRGGASVHDGVAPSSTCRGRLGRYRHRCSSLAPTERCRRFRAADGGCYALARQPAALNSPAGSGRRTRPMAA
jgi:hypothetical protein